MRSLLGSKLTAAGGGAEEVDGGAETVILAEGFAGGFVRLDA